MRLELYRYSSKKDSTLGLLFLINDETNKKDFLCFTLEDEVRDVKVYGETAIPEGTYPIEFRKEGGFHQRYSARYKNSHYGMLEIKDIPN